MKERSPARRLALGAAVVGVLVLPALVAYARHHHRPRFRPMASQEAANIFGSAEESSRELIDQGRQIFRFDTFGDEA